MPEIRLSAYQDPPPAHGLRPFQVSHVLTLNLAHLTEETIRVLVRNIEAASPDPDLARTGITVLRDTRQAAWCRSEHIAVDLVDPSGCNASLMPPDLLECVQYAASYGFDQILFDEAHPDDLPYCAALPVCRKQD